MMESLGTLVSLKIRTRSIDPALVAVIAVVVITFLLFDRPLAVGDGLAYLIWLDSIALDGDLDLSNQAEKFGHVNTYHIYYNPNTGRWASAFPFGLALLLTPFYWLGALLDQLPAFHVNDAHFLGIQGVRFAYSFFSMLGVNLYAIVTVALGYAIARRWATRWVAAAATIAIYLGTPLIFYATVDPINSHIAGAFSASLLLFLWLRARERTIQSRPALSPRFTRFGATDETLSTRNKPIRDRSLRGAVFATKQSRRFHTGEKATDWRSALPWVLVGLATGLTALSRWQVALIAVPIGVELLFRRRLREAVALGVGFLLLAWLIPYSWWRMYGKLALIPATEGDTSAVLIGPVNTLKVLFSPIAGLFPWSPVAALALIGLVPVARRDWPLALGAAVMFILQALVNGMVKNWWAGIGFGMRRMAELYPLYVLLLAALLAAARARGRPVLGIALGLTAACAVYGVILLLARFTFTWTNPWGLARDTPLKEIRYSFSRDKLRLLWPVIQDHVGVWAWRKPGP
jgi:hypothetical protein